MLTFTYGYKRLAIDLAHDLIGAILYAIGITIFTLPNQIAPGGVTGLATIANYLSGLPIGGVSIFLNIPLFFLAYKFLGTKFALKSMKSSLILSLMLDIFAGLNPPLYKGDQLLAGLFGGIFMGAGIAIIFSRGSTAGGTDIIARIIQKKLQHFPIGKAIIAIDFFVLVASMIVFQNIESGLVGLITLFTLTTVIDTIVYGIDKGKIIQVFSNHSQEIATSIIKETHRGVTFLKTVGAYTGEDRLVLMCVVRNSQYPVIKKIIYAHDPLALIVISQADEIIGSGFKVLEDNNK